MSPCGKQQRPATAARGARAAAGRHPPGTGWYGPAELARAQGAAAALGLETLEKWPVDNRPLAQGQWAKRRQSRRLRREGLT